MKPIDSMWTEKYRPKKVSEMVGDFKDKILKYLENQQTIPHFLLYSKKPGTGKTTLAKAIINELGCDAIVLNSSDDRKIDVIRDKVKQFSMTKSTKQGMRRCVFLDEFDGMLKASQNALRNLMETYASNVFFILTCNNIHKVIEPLQSRCLKIGFAFPNKDEIYKYLHTICQMENLNCTEGGIRVLIDMNYPSIRNCVLVLQDLKTDGKDVIEENIKSANEEYDVLWKKLVENDWKYIKKIVLKSDIDPRELNTFFWEKAVEHEKLRLIQICCRNEKDIAWGANPKIVFVTSLIEAIK